MCHRRICEAEKLCPLPDTSPLHAQYCVFAVVAWHYRSTVVELLCLQQSQYVQFHRVSSGHPSLLTVLFKHQQLVVNKIDPASLAQKLQHTRITILQRLTTHTNKRAGKLWAAAWVQLLQGVACTSDTVLSTLCTAFGVLASFAACI